MPWATLNYTRKQVDAAGRALASPLDQVIGDEPLSVISNWRAIHSFPLNTIQMGLRRFAENADNHSLVSQRLKRLSSIASKLRRFDTMHLSQMQDIGGCRAVVKSVAAVRSIVGSYESSNVRHALVREDDYILSPKSSGYRGIHRIYRYYSDKNDRYNGLKIEVQIRSNLQHAWATSVETIGTFIRQSLKSSQGEEDWLRFFALMGTAIALRERAPSVPGTPSERSVLKRELRQYVKKLRVQAQLQVFGQALQLLQQPKKSDRYYLLQLDPTARTIEVTGYSFGSLGQASADYLAAEERAIATQHGSDAVLVAVESLDALRKAYPNYFLDTSLFIDAVDRAIE